MCWSSGKAGRSTNISVASIITLVVGYRTLKTLGIFEKMRGLGAHKGTCFTVNTQNLSMLLVP